MTIRILDGGMGQEIFHRTGRPDAGWSAMAAVDHFEIVRDLHAEFLAAGADIITTNTYALGRWRMNRQGHADAFASANQTAARAAQEARERVNPMALIAGSIGPVRSSYEPDVVPPTHVVEMEVAEQAIVLSQEVDLFICETITLSGEAVGAVRAAASTGKPVWAAFTLHEMGPAVLRGGEGIGEAVRALDGLGVEAVLLNCTAPEAVDRGIGELAGVARGAFGAYANAFVPVDPALSHGGSIAHTAARTDITPEVYAAHAAHWIAAGATIVGGCCEVGPAHIRLLAEMVRSAP